jgi:hypothetical protein
MNPNFPDRLLDKKQDFGRSYAAVTDWQRGAAMQFLLTQIA